MRLPNSTPIGSRSITARPMACTRRTASCSTTNRRSAAKPSSPARSAAPSPRSSAACKSGSISAISTRSAIGATPATMSKACGSFFNKKNPTTMCSLPARRIRCANSSNGRSAASAGRSFGRDRAPTSAAYATAAASAWSRSIRTTTARPRSTCCSAIRRRPGSGSAGATRPASNNWLPKWSKPTGGRSNAETPTMPTNSPYALQNKRVWVAGHRGLVGAALARRLATEQCEILTVAHVDCDLRHAPAVDAWMTANRPHAVFVAAARVGGIYANDSRPADFIYDNLMIAANVIEAAWRTGVEKLLFLGSTCIYPRLAPQPMPEDSLLTGPLEPTNQWYAIAKIAGIKLAQAYRRQHGCDFISAMPTNLYGLNDNYDL